MKKGVPQPSFEEGAQKLPCDTGQYLVSWLHLAARETDAVFILHGHAPSHKCYLYGRRENGDWQTATSLPHSLSSAFASSISQLSPYFECTYSFCLYFRKLCVQSVDHLGVSLTTFPCLGAAYLPSVSVTKFSVSMSFFET